MEQDHFVFLEIAFEDLNASQELYNSNHFPHSIYFLQQSIEKIVKFIGLNNKIIKASDLMRPIGHKTSKIFKKETIKYQKLTEFDTKEELLSDFQRVAQFIHDTPDAQLIPELKVIINSFNNSSSEGLLASALDSQDNLISFIKQYDESGEIDIKQLKEYFENPQYNEFLMGFMKKLKSNLAYYVKAIQVLFVLTSYFEKFVSTVRYPDNQFNLPSYTYSSSNVLVKSVPYFQKETYSCLKRIQRYYSYQTAG